MKLHKISLALALLLVLSATAGCGSAGQGQTDTGNGTTGNTSAEDTTAAETDYLKTLELKNFDGYEYRIIAQSYDQRPNLPLADEETGEVLNDTIIARNRMVEDLLNITIVNMPFENRDEVKTKVRTASMSDEDA